MGVYTDTRERQLPCHFKQDILDFEMYEHISFNGPPLCSNGQEVVGLERGPLSLVRIIGK
jgi:hypothetical protein